MQKDVLKYKQNAQILMQQKVQNDINHFYVCSNLI